MIYEYDFTMLSRCPHRLNNWLYNSNTLKKEEKLHFFYSASKVQKYFRLKVACKKSVHIRSLCGIRTLKYIYFAFNVLSAVLDVTSIYSCRATKMEDVEDGLDWPKMFLRRHTESVNSFNSGSGRFHKTPFTLGPEVVCNHHHNCTEKLDGTLISFYKNNFIRTSRLKFGLKIFQKLWT